MLQEARPTPVDLDLPAVPFTARQALEGGLRRSQLDRLVEENRVRRVLRGVYVRADVEDTVELRAQAAVLVLPPHAVLTDRAAAWLWGVDAYAPDGRWRTPVLDVSVLPGYKRITRAEASGGERSLLPEDLARSHGVAVTTPLRTSADLGCGLPPYEALAAMDSFAAAHGVDKAALVGLLPRFRGRRGVVQLRRLVPLVDPRTESTGESFTKLAIVDAGLPLPEPQFWVVDRGHKRFRLDLSYPWLKICIEYDGQQHHSSEADRAADEERRRWLRRNGWIVIVVTKDSFVGDALDGWLHQLRASIAVRTAG